MIRAQMAGRVGEPKLGAEVGFRLAVPVSRSSENGLLGESGSAMVAASGELLCENPVAVARAASAHIESKVAQEAHSSEGCCERWSAATLCRTARGLEVLDYQGLAKVPSAHEVPSANPKSPSLAKPLATPSTARTSTPSPFPGFQSGAPLRCQFPPLAAHRDQIGALCRNRCIKKSIAQPSPCRRCHPIQESPQDQVIDARKELLKVNPQHIGVPPVQRGFGSQIQKARPSLGR